VFDIFIKTYTRLLIGSIFILVDPNVLAEKFWPNNIYDIDGMKIDVEILSKNKTVCMITIKSIGCPVCTEQLIRFRKKMKEFNRCNVTFIVLAPGVEKGVRELKRKTQFPFPFISDKDLAIAKRFDLIASFFEIMPAIVLFEKDGSVGWSQIGRGPEYFSDQAIIDYIDCSNWI